MVIPLPVGGERRGVFEVASTREDRFSADDLRFAQAVAQWVGMVAQRAELAERVAREAAAQTVNSRVGMGTTFRLAVPLSATSRTHHP